MSSLHRLRLPCPRSLDTRSLVPVLLFGVLWLVALGGVARADVIVVGGPAPDFSSLADAIEAAQGGDVVQLAPGVHELDRRASVTATDVVIEGAGALQTVVVWNEVPDDSASSAGTLIWGGYVPQPPGTPSSPDITIRGICFVGLEDPLVGTTYYNGLRVEGCWFVSCSTYWGVIRGSKFDHIENCVFVDCESEARSPAITVHEVDRIQNCYFLDCRSNEQGGAVTITGEGLIRDCHFEGNQAVSWGGALYCEGTVLESCSFVGNTAQAAGAAHFDVGCRAIGCRFEGNQAVEHWGGALVVEGGNDPTQPGILVACTFLDNHAGEDGGALGFRGLLLSWGNLYQGNTADEDGGVVENFAGQGTFLQDWFVDNQATGRGGALALGTGSVNPFGDSEDFGDQHRVLNSVFVGNVAHGAAAIACDNYAVCTVDGCTFLDNTSTSFPSLFSSLSPTPRVEVSNSDLGCGDLALMLGWINLGGNSFCAE